MRRGRLGGSVAEWSKALFEREKMNKNQKIPGPNLIRNILT